MVFVVIVSNLTNGNCHAEIHIFFIQNKKLLYVSLLMCMFFFLLFLFKPGYHHKHTHISFLLYEGLVDVYTIYSFVFAFIRHIFNYLDAITNHTFEVSLKGSCMVIIHVCHIINSWWMFRIIHLHCITSLKQCVCCFFYYLWHCHCPPS